MPPSDLALAVSDDRSLRARLLAVYPELAEDEQALMDTLDGVSDLNEQIVAAMRVAVEREALAEGLAGLIGKLTERKTRLTYGAERIRGAVLHAMIDAGRQKIPAPDMTLLVSQGRAGVTVTDPALIPDEYVVIVRKPDLKAITDATKAGSRIAGTAPKNPTPYLTVRLS